MSIYKSVGALGLLLISVGILNRRRFIQDWFYIAGGICLEIYSIYLGDLIFIFLQIIFTAAAIYDLIKLGYARKTIKEENHESP